ncbi:MAG: hypothetical protein FJY65_09290 [Calditrichaeota bacterium]|nr:hypothetical protein [Calditrichota bacterium]
MEDLTRLGVFLPRFIWELLTAIICGGLIGLERGTRRQPNALRNFILICFGAALYMIMSDLIVIGLGETGSADLGQIAAAAALAAALIGAGVIISRKGDLVSVSTAAAIWVTAAIGLVIGVGYPLLGLMITGMVIFTLTLLHSVEERLAPKPRPILIKLVAREDNADLRARLQSALEREGVHPDTLRAEIAPNGVKITISAVSGPADVKSLLTALWTTPGVVEVEI